MFSPVKDTVVVRRRHSQALRRAHSGAQATKAALGQVNVKPGCIQALGHAIAGLANGHRRFDGLDLYTVYRAYLRTFIAHDAVVNGIVQLVASPRWHRQALVRVLERGRPCLEVGCMGNGQVVGSRAQGFAQVLPSQAQAFP